VPVTAAAIPENIPVQKMIPRNEQASVRQRKKKELINWTLLPGQRLLS
jgi:hypothetical protein